jgi:predicted metal-dependent HD superfamily phosphohydrolase
VEKELTRVKIFINELFSRRNQVVLKYHNLHHTENVVARCYEIASHFDLTNPELFCLISAAWFHDCGHLFNELADHEKAGSDLMAAFLKSCLTSDSLITIITNCIIVTKMPSRPVTEIEKIICDADTYHFGTPEFLITDTRIYEEMESRLSIHISNKIDKSIRLLESHQFFTPYCQETLNSGKKKNIDYLKSLIK